MLILAVNYLANSLALVPAQACDVLLFYVDRRFLSKKNAPLHAAGRLNKAYFRRSNSKKHAGLKDRISYLCTLQLRF